METKVDEVFEKRRRGRRAGIKDVRCVGGWRQHIGWIGIERERERDSR